MTCIFYSVRIYFAWRATLLNINESIFEISVKHTLYLTSITTKMKFAQQILV
jgi:hypothetical protein